MQHLGRIVNRSHNGLFAIICDSTAQFGGWDDYGEALADEGSQPLVLGELRAFVEEADGRYGGDYQIYQSDDGVVWIAPPREPGIDPLDGDRIEHEPRTEVGEATPIDVPSGVLTIAIAYPALNQEATGDHAGVVHAKDERLDIALAPGAWSLARERTATGQILALRPVPQ